MNHNYIIKVKENLISELTSSKVAFELNLLSEEEYTTSYEAISQIKYYSDYVEKASDVACAQIISLIDLELKKGEDYKKGIILLNHKGKSGNRLCDVIIVSKNNIHVMKVVSMECDFIEASQSNELMKIGYEVIDRFICETSSETIDLTIIQPNLLTSSGCSLSIDTLLDRFDNRLIQ